MINRLFVSRRGIRLAPVFTLAAALTGVPAAPALLRAQDPVTVVRTSELQRFSTQELDNLLGPVALYPDALLAQVLVAATFPDQIADAAQFVRANGTATVDEQPWDVSVRAVAHYPSALNTLADKLDWTTALGQAYALQSSECMAAVQRLRRMAADQGNLISTPQQQVLQERGGYVIVPAQPRVIYVPVYDPIVVYRRPVFNLGVSGRYWSFGVGFPIGGWLTYDVDWGMGAVYYNGWDDGFLPYGGGWRVRARPYVRLSSYYIGPRFRTIVINRDVWNRPVDFAIVDRFARVHPDVDFRRRYDDGRRGPDRDEARGYDRGIGRGDVRDGRGDDRGGAGRIDDRRAVPRGAAEPLGDPRIARPGDRGGDRPDAAGRGADRQGGATPGPVVRELDRRALPRGDHVRIERRDAPPAPKDPGERVIKGRPGGDAPRPDPVVRSARPRTPPPADGRDERRDERLDGARRERR